jgi:long-subunit fatty acid transport protein
LGFALVLIAASAPCFEAKANIGQEYGFGARTAGLAGAGAAYGFGAFAAYNNPAGLPFQGDKRLILDIGVLDMNPNFTSIDNVVIENNYTSDKSPPVYGSVANDYRATLGEELGIAYRMFPDFFNLTLGIAAYVPLQQLAYMDTGETFEPEYFLYRARTQRPQVEAGLGFDITPRLHFGLGLHLAFSLTSSATVFLQTDATKPSTMRFSASLKPKVAPQFGFLYTSETENPTDEPRFTLGAVVRLPVASDNSLYLQSGARAFGSFAALDFDFSALSSLFYDPLSLELGATFAETPVTRTYVQFEYQFWGAYQSPALFIQTPNLESCNSGSGPCGVNISGGQNPSFAYRNIFVPRIGQEYVIGKLTLRAGYAYRPGIIADGGVGTSGPGNYLDPSKHIFTAGAGYHFLHFLNFDVPCDVDLNLAYQALVTEHVTKAPGDENGAGTGDLKIGAPGYDAGGSVYGGGLSLTLAF